MSEIVGDVTELNSLTVEIKRVSKQLKVLRERKKEIENRIKDFLEEKNQPGLKYRGVAVVTEEKGKRVYKKKSEREMDGTYVLEKHGITNSKEVLDELLEAMKGDLENNLKLKIRNI